ncbi:hypothetical protein [Priestia megaterium]|uniref:hypothetical protein n=1 Tax=Priestia megaterium TaxID=1404 RepID=UPI0020D27CA2|nr:hypothetical protein [Priestia megaterium]
MMFKEVKALSSKWLSNPHQELSLHERLKRKQSIDLRDNHIIVDLGNGYDEIKPINPDKRYN